MLQKQVSIYPDIAIEGSLYRAPVEATAGLAEVDTLVGRGLFSSVAGTGNITDLVSNVKAKGAVYAGIAYRANVAPNFDIQSQASMTVPKGFNVSILALGSIWVNNTVAVAKMGNNVFVSDTDGTIQTQAGLAELDGYTATSYKVIGLQTDGAVNSLILISNTQG